MKKTATATVALMLFSALAGSAGRYKEPEPPQPIHVQALTERMIKDEIRHERERKRLQQSIKTAAFVYRQLGCRTTYAEATGRVAVEYGLSPRLLAGLVFVESSCNPNAVSGRDSVGLTQINPKYNKYSRAELKNPERNLEIGASILIRDIQRYGLVEGLHAYNGFGAPAGEYSTKVLTAAGIKVT
jgi:hypothetical protein